MKEIPAKDHHLFDGFDGGKKPSDEALKALLATAPASLQERANEWADVQQKNLLFIEHEGALYRGPHRGVPLQVWVPGEQQFVPYKLAGQPKEIDWGTLIPEEQAKRMMGVE